MVGSGCGTDIGCIWEVEYWVNGGSESRCRGRSGLLPMWSIISESAAKKKKMASG